MRSFEEFEKIFSPFEEKLESDVPEKELWDTILKCERFLEERKEEIRAHEDEVTEADLYQYQAYSWEVLFFKATVLQNVTESCNSISENLVKTRIRKLIERYEAIIESYQKQTSSPDERTAGYQDGVEMTLMSVVSALEKFLDNKEE